MGYLLFLLTNWVCQWYLSSQKPDLRFIDALYYFICFYLIGLCYGLGVLLIWCVGWLSLALAFQDIVSLCSLACLPVLVTQADLKLRDPPPFASQGHEPLTPGCHPTGSL